MPALFVLSKTCLMTLAGTINESDATDEGQGSLQFVCFLEHRDQFAGLVSAGIAD